MRSPLKLKFWRSPLIPQVSNAIAPQIEILAIAPHPTSFSAIAPQVEILAIAPHPISIKCDRPLNWDSLHIRGAIVPDASGIDSGMLPSERRILTYRLHRSEY